MVKNKHFQKKTSKVEKVLELLYLYDSIDDKSTITPNNMLKSLLELLDLTTLTNITTITTLTTLTNKEKILLLLLEPNTISNISKELNLSLDLISKNISFKQRQTGLLYEELIEKYDDKRYIINKKGIYYLKSVFEECKEREQNKEKIKLETLSIEERIKKYKEYFNEIRQEIIQNINQDKKYIQVDFKKLCLESPELAERILDYPEESIKEAEIGIEQLDNIGDISNFKVRFYNLPNTQKINIGELRTKHLNKFIKVIGSPVMVSEVRPHVISAKFECPSCGNIINILQLETKFKEPQRCGCGRKGKFRLMDKEMIDSQGLKIEELGEDLGIRTNQKTINVLLSNDLTHIDNQPFFENTQPIIINGILKEVPMPSKDGGKLTRFDLMIQANSIEIDDKIRQVSLNDKIIKELKEQAKLPNIINKLINSFAPNIYDKEKEKEILFYSIVSGGHNALNFRDDSHILLPGDPGTAKSSLALEVKKVVPGSRWISGKGTTGTGLIGTVVKDTEFGGNVVLQKGALPMANLNVCICDELDKMGENNTDALHEALENQYCSIDKWNKHQRFRTDTTFIACCNPFNSRFDRDKIIIDQIKLPSSLLDRFDMILPFYDHVGQQDAKLAEKICDLFDGSESYDDNLSLEFIKHYLYYAKNHFNPKINKEAKQLLKNYFVSLRVNSLEDPSKVKITPRNMTALLRLTRARAKLRLSNKANIEDAKRVIELYSFFMNQLGFNIESNILHNITKEETPIDWDPKLIHYVKCKVQDCFETECNFDLDGVPYCKQHWEIMARR